MQAEEYPLLQVRNLRKVFEGLVAVNNVSFEVERGTVFGLIGPNGAGKTTLFNVITGIYAPTDGTVVLNGEVITGLPQDAIAARGVARTFQNLQIFHGMSVEDNVLVGCHRHGRCGLLATIFRLPAVRAEERQLRNHAMEALQFVGLQDFARAPASSLPPGRQRLVEIARALASEPCLLLLDEPAAGLTTHETEVLGELLQRIAATGLTIIIIEHDMNLVMDICATVAVLDQGEVLTIDSPSAVQADPRVIAAYLGEPQPEEGGAGG